MAAPTLAVICAWCHRTIAPGSTGAPVTHTICPACLDWTINHPVDAVRAPVEYADDVWPAGYFDATGR
jgi:hypothetical protein